MTVEEQTFFERLVDENGVVLAPIFSGGFGMRHLREESPRRVLFPHRHGKLQRSRHRIHYRFTRGDRGMGEEGARQQRAKEPTSKSLQKQTVDANGKARTKPYLLFSASLMVDPMVEIGLGSPIFTPGRSGKNRRMDAHVEPR